MESAVHWIELAPVPKARNPSKIAPPTAFTHSLSNIETAVDAASTNSPGLAPFDGGRHAWQFVICASILETMVWGFGFTYARGPLHQSVAIS
jgi:hypothetical protein